MRTVVGDRSNACRCARNPSTAGTGSPPASRTVQDSAPSGISTRCTRFLFAMVNPGIIVANTSSIAGPIIWFLAVAITPFGVPPLRRALTSSTHDTAHVDHLSAESAGHK